MVAAAGAGRGVSGGGAGARAEHGAEWASEERPRALSGGAGVCAWEAQTGRTRARMYNVSRAWEAQREIFARLWRAYRNRGPAGHPPDFVYTVRNSVENHL